jgi:hypothetical protein
MKALGISRQLSVKSSKGASQADVPLSERLTLTRVLNGLDSEVKRQISLENERYYEVII